MIPRTDAPKKRLALFFQSPRPEAVRGVVHLFDAVFAVAGKAFQIFLHARALPRLLEPTHAEYRRVHETPPRAQNDGHVEKHRSAPRRAAAGAETGRFTTLDLITCQPETGEAAFFKYGAAPSYVKKGGTVRRITGGTLPAGLRGGAAAPDVTRATLEPGSFAVMVSDGVADPGRDEWLQNLLAGWDGEDPQTLAGLILSESVRRENLQDDCGVQVLYLSRESGVKKV